MADDMHKVWARYGKAGAWALIVVLAGMAIGWLWVQRHPTSAIPTAPWCLVMGGFLVLWSILAELGWEIGTWSADTPSERLNRCLFRALNMLGIAILTIGTSVTLFGSGAR